MFVNPKKTYNFEYSMQKNLSDDKLQLLFRPERTKIASLNSPEDAVQELISISEEFENLKISKYASLMLKLAEGLGDSNFEAPEVGPIEIDSFKNTQSDNGGSTGLNRPTDYNECGICGYDHHYDLMNDKTFREAAEKHVKEGTLPEEFIKRLTNKAESQ